MAFPARSNFRAHSVPLPFYFADTDGVTGGYAGSLQCRRPVPFLSARKVPSLGRSIENRNTPCSLGNCPSVNAKTKMGENAKLELTHPLAECILSRNNRQEECRPNVRG